MVEQQRSHLSVENLDACRVSKIGLGDDVTSANVETGRKARKVWPRLEADAGLSAVTVNFTPAANFLGHFFIHPIKFTSSGCEL